MTTVLHYKGHIESCSDESVSVMSVVIKWYWTLKLLYVILYLLYNLEEKKYTRTGCWKLVVSYLWVMPLTYNDFLKWKFRSKIHSYSGSFVFGLEFVFFTNWKQLLLKTLPTKTKLPVTRIVVDSAALHLQCSTFAVMRCTKSMLLPLISCRTRD